MDEQEKRLRAAKARAAWEGDHPLAPDLILDAYLDPDSDQAALRREKVEEVARAEFPRRPRRTAGQSGS